MGNCKCLHHAVIKVMVGLAWLAAIGFWWAAAFKQTLLWMDAEHLFKDVVILSLLVFLSKFCACCSMTGNRMCSHSEGCKCGDCGICK